MARMLGILIALIIGQAQATIVEENDLWLGPDFKSGGGITKEQFDGVIAKFSDLYKPIVRKAGGRLKIIDDWENGTVNARAYRSWGVWNVHMFGGLARHPKMSVDGFATVLCHELGHHLAGAPTYKGWLQKWASGEGQSDYYATSKCMKRYFDDEDNERIVAGLEIPASVRQGCEGTYEGPNAINICLRTSMAGLDLARTLNSLKSNSAPVSFETPSEEKVEKTYLSHPKAQCRLDTYTAGALCNHNINDRPSRKDPAVGYCSRKKSDVIGIRPLCWFAPKS